MHMPQLKKQKKGIDGKKAECKTSNCCNCYLSIVIQCIMGTRSYIFFPCKLEAPTNLILALRRFKNMLYCGENQRVANLKDDFMTFSRKLMH